MTRFNVFPTLALPRSGVRVGILMGYNLSRPYSSTPSVHMQLSKLSFTWVIIDLIYQKVQ